MSERTIITPAIGEQRTRLIAEVDELLRKGNFQRRDFAEYIDRMIDLVGGVTYVLDQAKVPETVKDSSAEPYDRTSDPTKWGLNCNGVNVRFTLPIANIDFFRSGTRESLHYVKNGPQLLIETRVPVSTEITYRSHILEQDYQAFPKGFHSIFTSEKLSSQQVVGICRKLFVAYCMLPEFQDIQYSS